MKTITTTATLLLLFLFAQTGFAQQAEDTKTEKYRIKIVKNENGKEKVIDESFASRQAMDEFIAENKLDAPEAPPVPPLPPLPPAPPSPPADAKCHKENKECRKTVIIEKEEIKDKK